MYRHESYSPHQPFGSLYGRRLGGEISEDSHLPADDSGGQQADWRGDRTPMQSRKNAGPCRNCRNPRPTLFPPGKRENQLKIRLWRWQNRAQASPGTLGLYASASLSQNCMRMKLNVDGKIARRMSVTVTLGKFRAR